MKNYSFIQLTFLFLDHVILLILISSWSILVLFEGFWKIKKSKIADPRWTPFENMTLFCRHMTTPANVVELKETFLDVLFVI